MSHIVLAGGSGMLGTALGSRLEEQGHAVVRLVRRPSLRPGHKIWNPDLGEIDPSALEGCDAAINLAGASISSRWTHARREVILESRVRSTDLLARECARHGVPVLVNASATGIYGNRGDQILDESSPCGGGFLADTCVAWEHAMHPAEQTGVRRVACRFGVILSRSGGALPKMLPAFKAGLGGPLGSGRQWMPWIHLDDAVAVVEHVLATSSIRGPVLSTAPQAIRQSQFATALARRLGRKAWLSTPGWVLRLAMGEMADELLLWSQRCRPLVLETTGFAWTYPDLEAALEALLAG